MPRSCVKALLLLAVMAHDGGNEPEAQRLVQRAAELDPDQRMAQALFADRLAAGDTALRQLVLGDEHASPSPQSSQLAGSSASGRLASPPLVRPLTGRLSDRVPSRAASGSLNQSVGSQPLSPLPSSSSPLPPESRRAFSEADNMIWGQDDEGRLSQPGAAPAPQAGTVPTAPAPPSQPVTPPVLAHEGTAMNETEQRQAIDWLHWLQAQGARVHPGALAPADTAAAGTTAAPPPRPEDLRSMFAELAPNTGENGRGIVEADIAAPASTNEPAAERAETAEPWAARAGDVLPAAGEDAVNGHWYELPTEHESEYAGPSAEQDAWSDTGALAAGWVPEADLPEGMAALREGTPSPSPGPASPNGTPDATLEDLERHFAASGFQSFEPHPGALAELAGTPAHQPTPSAAPTAPAEPEPAPDDYPARLARARQLRQDGRTDEALTEYRAVLKNAPDLLDAVLDELTESLGATPEHPDVHRLLGDARIRQGDYLGALEAYNRAVALTPASDY